MQCQVRVLHVHSPVCFDFQILDIAEELTATSLAEEHLRSKIISSVYRERIHWQEEGKICRIYRGQLAHFKIKSRSGKTVSDCLEKIDNYLNTVDYLIGINIQSIDTHGRMIFTFEDDYIYQTFYQDESLFFKE